MVPVFSAMWLVDESSLVQSDRISLAARRTLVARVSSIRRYRRRERATATVRSASRIAELAMSASCRARSTAARLTLYLGLGAQQLAFGCAIRC